MPKMKAPTRGKAQIKADVDRLLTKRSATVIVYSRPSGYWYARAYDTLAGDLITDASGHSREEALRELRGKFAMIGVTIKSVTDEDPYVTAR